MFPSAGFRADRSPLEPDCLLSGQQEWYRSVYCCLRTVAEGPLADQQMRVFFLLVRRWNVSNNRRGRDKREMMHKQ